MKNQIKHLLIALTLLSALNSQLSIAFAQGTAFTYQGRLQNNGSPASGTYNLTFAVFTDSNGVNQVGSTLTNTATGITNGLFTVVLDFGQGIFTGPPLWLQIGAETNGGGGFTTLAPLQQLTPTPYAIYSPNAGSAVSANGVAAGSVTGAGIAGNSVVKSLNNLQDAVTLAPGANVTITPSGNTLTIASSGGGGGGGSNNWSLTGNSGTTAGIDFLGTTDNQPLELHVNGTLAFRLVPGYYGNPNVVGGWQNSVGPYADAVTIAGGYGNSASGTAATVGGGYANTANGNYATLGGGIGNYANGTYATMCGGQNNSVAGQHAAVGGGSDNQAGNEYSTVAGGYQNINYGIGAFIGGGGYDGTTFAGNTAAGAASTVAGGLGNIAGNTYATVGGGYGNQATGPGSFVGGGGYDGNSYIGNTASGKASTVAGGIDNQATAPWATVGGGAVNTSSNGFATVGGGHFNTSGGEDATVGGGESNQAEGTYATIPGGLNNIAKGYASFAAGQLATANDNNSFVWGDGSRAVASQGANTFTVLAIGGAYFYTTPGGVDVVMDSNGDLDFGTTTRQMINLYSSTYGIGVQANDEYFRTAGQFYWYLNGSHNNANGNSGGGTQLMELDNSGNLITKGTVTANGVLLTSDRNAKENFASVDSQAVLAKVASLPVTEWNYKTDSKGVQHIGPMAQDFQAAFGLDGTDDKHISVVDEGGVALAAIQGLNQKLQEELNRQDAKNAKLKQQNDSLAQRLNELEAAVKQLAAQK
jgi:hypothetical protein